MIQDADGGLKDRFGRVAYIWTAAKELRSEPFKARIEVDGDLWYKGAASCVLVGNVGSLFAGVDVFENAHPDDGLLELGVTNAEGLGDWARTLAHTVIGTATKIAFRSDDEGREDRRRAEPQGALRARRRRARRGQAPEGRVEPRVAHGSCARRTAGV